MVNKGSLYPIHSFEAWVYMKKYIYSTLLMICVIWWILHGFMETRLGNERMKKGQISRHTKRKLGIRWVMDILMNIPSHSHLKTQQFYYAQEDRLACLSKRSFQGTRLQLDIWEQETASSAFYLLCKPSHMDHRKACPVSRVWPGVPKCLRHCAPCH